jgi:hypothetical protein
VEVLSSIHLAGGTDSMSLRPGESAGRAIAVFPFLKTAEPIRLGSVTFRSTDDTADLGEQDAIHVREIAAMLFLQDDLRITLGVIRHAPSPRFG